MNFTVCELYLSEVVKVNSDRLLTKMINLLSFFFSITEYLNLPASLVAQIIKNLPAMQETLVRFLAQEDPLEKGMATHSSILAWKIPWREESDGLQSMGLQRVRRD